MIEDIFRFQIKVINCLNTVLIAYLDICTLVLIDTKYSAFFSESKQILDQNNSIDLGDYRESPNEKQSKNFYSKLLDFRKTQISLKIF